MIIRSETATNVLRSRGESFDLIVLHSRDDEYFIPLEIYSHSDLDN